MLALDQSVRPDTSEWQHFYEKLQTSTTLASLVLTSWQIGLWFAKTVVEQQLDERAKRPPTIRCALRDTISAFIIRFPVVGCEQFSNSGG
ncbi:MAG: hypothetical protein HC866_06130 [Leptolyngbyaceae cyanobacterium RU_5_1]|nr:hypothetical protein [Leptolyngbyaceae cyanobacterium RU_5_1]